MIALNPSARPCAKQVLAHPFFWSDMKKLSFLADVSDRLSFFKNGTGLRENKELIASFEKHCRIVLTCINSSYSRVSWATKIDSCVLIAPNSRNYDTTSTCDLLRLIRNKRSHYNELPASVQQTLGKLPCYDREENLNHNFWQYFHRRFPKLLITVYTFVIERQEFLEDTHLQGYGISQRNNPIDSNDTTIDGHSRRYSMELSSTTKTEWRKLRGKERKQYSIELLQQLKPDHLLPPYSLG